MTETATTSQGSETLVVWRLHRRCANSSSKVSTFTGMFIHSKVAVPGVISNTVFVFIL